MFFFLRKSGHFILKIVFLRCDYFSAANPSRPAVPGPSARGRQPDPGRPPPPKCGDASGGHDKAAPVRAPANARGFTGAAVIQCRGGGAARARAPLKRRHNTGMNVDPHHADGMDLSGARIKARCVLHPATCASIANNTARELRPRLGRHSNGRVVAPRRPPRWRGMPACPQKMFARVPSIVARLVAVTTVESSFPPNTV